MQVFATRTKPAFSFKKELAYLLTHQREIGKRMRDIGKSSTQDNERMLQSHNGYKNIIDWEGFSRPFLTLPLTFLES